ncbi:hypothetical protein CP157_01113 [Paracoccus marcusii]|uniref:hypothetical protein n=1 Tax=Paracoccus marcusii TaxID=59779 RepID=UPI001C3DEC20|nr:hypothetical protein [Paracoccus marcusii]QXI63395.1 hypothetical protein CP157_01113 [Paracoccus marcusii]
MKLADNSNLAHKTLERRQQAIVQAIARLDDAIRNMNVEIGEAQEERADLETEARQITEILEGGAA